MTTVESRILAGSSAEISAYGLATPTAMVLIGGDRSSVPVTGYTQGCGPMRGRFDPGTDRSPDQRASLTRPRYRTVGEILAF